VIKPGYQHCYDQVPGLERELLATWHPDLIVVIDRVERTEALVGGQPVAAGTPEFQLLSTRALTDFARMMTAGGSRLVFLELPPVVPASCLVPSKLDSAQCAVPVNSDAVTNQANSIFRAVAAAVPGVSSISISDAICPAGACAPVVGGLMLRYDGDHFSGPAAEHLAPIIYQRLVAAGAFTPAG